MALRFSSGLRDSMLDSSGLRGALANGTIYIYSGAQPANADGAATGTLLGQVTVDAGAFTHGVATNGLNLDPAAGGVIAKAGAEDWKFNGIVNGTAGWFRFSGNVLDDGSPSTTLSRIDGSIAKTGGDLSLSNTSITAGAPNTIDVFQLNMAEN